MPKEYSDFLDKFGNNNILVAFGTAWQPSYVGIQNLVLAAKEMKNIGFVISLKEQWKHYEFVK